MSQEEEALIEKEFRVRLKSSDRRLAALEAKIGQLSQALIDAGKAMTASGIPVELAIDLQINAATIARMPSKDEVVQTLAEYQSEFKNYGAIKAQLTRFE